MTAGKLTEPARGSTVCHMHIVGPAGHAHSGRSDTLESGRNNRSGIKKRPLRACK